MRSNRSSGQVEQSASVIRLCRGMSLPRTTLVGGGGGVGDLGDGGGGLEAEGQVEVGLEHRDRCAVCVP